MAKAQSPGHITGFFKIYPNGSTGSGINIENGMITEIIQSNKDTFYLNGKKTKLLVSKQVLKEFRKKTKIPEKVKVLHKTVFPVGYGLGISGAGALSLAIALDKQFKTKLKKEEIIQIASNSEIQCGTGLGDVRAETYHGSIIGKKPYPSKKAEQLKKGKKFVVMGFFAPINTKKIIRNKKWKQKINKIGTYCMHKIHTKKTIETLIHLSRAFTIESDLATKKIRKIMEKIPTASMAMLGETIFIPTNNPKKTEKELRECCTKAMTAKIALKGAGPL